MTTAALFLLAGLGVMLGLVSWSTRDKFITWPEYTKRLRAVAPPSDRFRKKEAV